MHHCCGYAASAHFTLYPSGMTVSETSASIEPRSAEPQGRRLRRLLMPVAVALALISAFLTFVVLTGLTPIVPSHPVVIGFLLINAATIMLLLLIIGREIWLVIQARRRGRAAARLHVQIVALFSVIAVLPAVLVSIVANVTLDRGLDRLFSGPTKAVIQNSLTIANAYLYEHAQLIRGDVLGMANDLNNARPLWDQDRQSFRNVLTQNAKARDLPGAMIIDKDSNVLETAANGITQSFITPAPDFLKNVTDEDPQIGVFIQQNYVAAVIRLRAFQDTFLYVARLLDPRVVAQLRQTQASVAEYSELESRKPGLQVAFALMYIVIAMTQELRTQRDELVSASNMIDSRRRFIEAVLSSASAGIIGVDEGGRIGILNRSAEKLIGLVETEAVDHPLSEVVPELNELMATAKGGSHRLLQGEIEINRAGVARNLSVRITAEQSGQAQEGYIITLDDITELVSAQRTSAWADVARRIAHEIKNPLTPIQLSAERIKRKFGKTIVEDRAVFDQCTD